MNQTLEEVQQLWPKIPVGKAKDYSNYKQKYLTFLYRTINIKDSNRPQGVVQWVAQCDCGKYIRVDIRNLKTRVSCGCKRKDSAAHLIKNIKGQIFGNLLVLEQTNQRVNRNVVWKCQCQVCGNIKYAIETNLRRGAVTSCGCQHSSGETQIKKILDNLNIRYQQEYTFSDLKNKNLLRFDFALFDNNNHLLGLLEFQGRQHYSNEKWGKIQREITDQMKRDYCQQNQIQLYEIKYNEEIEVKLKQILEEIYGD